MGVLKRIRSGALRASFIWALTGFVLIGIPAHADTVALQENKIKAGLLYNFLKYTTWPENNQAGPDKIRICLFGGDAFAGALDPLEGRTAQRRNIVIRRVSEIESLRDCHVVFIHRSEEGNLPALLRTLEPYPILSVSDIRGFSRQGGMVEFSRQEDQRIHLYIKKEIVEKSRLRIHDRMLKLAEAR